MPTLRVSQALIRSGEIYKVKKAVIWRKKILEIANIKL